MDIFSLKNKTAIVTGALGLIGKKHCEALVMAGAHVVVADVDEAKAKQFALELGEGHLGIAVDVSNKASLENALNEIQSKYNTIDVLVNNAAIDDKFENPAMVREFSAFENYPLETFQRSINVNITGVC